MHKLIEPSISIAEVVDIAALHSRGARKAVLQDATFRRDVIQRESDYKTKMSQGRAYSIDSSEDVAGRLNEDEAKYIYERLNSYKYNEGSIADYIFSLAEYTKCAYCGHAVPSQLDHYLPRSRYVEYSFCPLNLIPSCGNCNAVGAKGGCYPTSSDNVFFHPYYDNPDDVQWLFAKISMTDKGLDVKFEVVKPMNWNDDKFKRVDYTFKKLGLSAVYSQDVLSKIYSMHKSLENLYDEAGTDELTNHFKQLAIDNKDDTSPNNWVQIVYRELSKRPDVCDLVKGWFSRL